MADYLGIIIKQSLSGPELIEDWSNSIFVRERSKMPIRFLEEQVSIEPLALFDGLRKRNPK